VKAPSLVPIFRQERRSTQPDRSGPLAVEPLLCFVRHLLRRSDR
jgi:hypothetical protein